MLHSEISWVHQYPVHPCFPRPCNSICQWQRDVGKKELRIRVGEVDVHFPVLIARELTQCILGADFLIKHKCVHGQHGWRDPGSRRKATYILMWESKKSPELVSVCHVSSTDAIIPGQYGSCIFWSRTPSSQNVQVLWNLLSVSWSTKAS